MNPVLRRAARARLAALAAALVVTSTLPLLAPAPARAAVEHPEVVSDSADPAPPYLAPTEAIARPHVNALGKISGMMVAGGMFAAVSDRGTVRPRSQVMAFDAATGALSTTFAPVVEGGQVWAVATDPSTNSVYLGGAFKTVNGVARAALAKVDATTGALDRSFAPVFSGGQINDLKLISNDGGKHLVAGGTPARKLMSLNPATGRDDRWLKLKFTQKLEGSWGGVAPYQLAVNPAGTRMAVTGNFELVNGQPRSKFVMVDLAPGGTSMSGWYYPGFAKPCTATAPRRVAYLQGVDFSPDGQSLSVAATGRIPLHQEDIWYARLGDANRPNTTVCDAVGRFRVADDSKPEWINYTGGDSVWSVADTGAAVYTAGHFRWMDNPDGYGSVGVGDETSGAPAASRRGIAALSPATGLALPWNPGLGQTRIGGKAFLADGAGLWIGNDASSFNGAPRYGLQRAPLALAPPPAAEQVVWAVGEACDNQGELTCSQVGSLIAADSATSAVLGLGDLQGPRGSLSDYQQHFDLAMGAGRGLKGRFYPVPGRLDYRTTDAAGYFDYWGSRAGSRSQGYYARTLGAWRLVGINSHCSKVGGCGGNQPQGRFMRSELSARDTTCELVIAHHSAFSDGLNGDNGWGRSVFNVAANNGADLILSSNDTGYQRFAARRANGTLSAEDGLTPFVVGTGGAEPRGWRAGAARSVFRQDDELGALRLVLSEGRWTSEFVSVDGEVLDASSGTCRS